MIKINRTDLLAELSLLSTVMERKITIPALGFAHAVLSNGVLHLTTTDTSVTIQTELPAEGDGWEGCLPISQLKALCRLLEGEVVTLSPKPNARIEVKCGQSRHILPMLTAEATVGTITSEGGFAVDGTRLREGLKRAIPCVGTQTDPRWQFQGVNFEVSSNILTLVASNAHRLIAIPIPVEAADCAFLVPPAALTPLLLTQGKSITIRGQGNQITFSCGLRVIRSRLLTGKFPNWKTFLPENLPYRVEVPVESLKSALKRARVTREERYHIGVGTVLGGVRLTFSKDALTVSVLANERGEAEEVIPVKSNLNGDNIEVGVNPDYVEDFLIGENLSWQMNNGKDVQLLSQGDCQYALVPRAL